LATRGDYAQAGKLKDIRTELGAKDQALQAAAEKVQSLAAARMYSEAAIEEQVRADLEAEISAHMKSVRAEFGHQLDMLPPELPSHQSSQGGWATRNVQTVRAEPVLAEPVQAEPVRVGRPVPTGDSLHAPLMRNAGYREQSPVFNGYAAPPGGIWSTEQYIGPTTFCLGFCITPLVVCCPCDTRRVYVAPNGQRYSHEGNGWRTALIIIYVFAFIASLILGIVIVSNGGVFPWTPCVGDGEYCQDSTECCGAMMCNFNDNECYYESYAGLALLPGNASALHNKSL